MTRYKMAWIPWTNLPEMEHNMTQHGMDTMNKSPEMEHNITKPNTTQDGFDTVNKSS